MALIKPGLVKVSDDDTGVAFLENKVRAGANVILTKDSDNTGYKTLVFSVPNTVGCNGRVIKVDNNVEIPNDVSLVLVDATLNSVTITLPRPAEVSGWLSLVCIGNEFGITVLPPEDVILFKPIDLTHTGNSVMLASDRELTWFCIGKNVEDWYC